MPHLDLLPLHGGDAAVPHYLGLARSLPRIVAGDQRAPGSTIHWSRSSDDIRVHVDRNKLDVTFAHVVRGSLHSVHCS